MNQKTSLLAQKRNLGKAGSMASDFSPVLPLLDTAMPGDGLEQCVKICVAGACVTFMPTSLPHNFHILSRGSWVLPLHNKVTSGLFSSVAFSVLD